MTQHDGATPRDCGECDRLHNAAPVETGLDVLDRASYLLDHYVEYERRNMSHVDCGGEPGIHEPLSIEAANIRAFLAQHG